MYRDNAYYGHAGILRRYCGVGREPSIPARLQHGWVPEGHLPEGFLAEPLPKLVWSRQAAEASRVRGYRDVRAIGAPFLYLPPSVAQPESLGPRSLVAFPFHGWEKERLNGDLSRYAESLEALAGHGFGPITVCLYWAEYEDESLRGCLESRGFRVVTNGHREGNPRFLYRQRDLLLAHRYVTSNRIATAAFYALSLCRVFFLYGPVMGLCSSRDPSGKLFAQWQAEHYPQLLWEEFSDTCHRDVADRELGRGAMLSPEAMRELFCWTPGGLLKRTSRRFRRRMWRLFGSPAG